MTEAGRHSHTHRRHRHHHIKLTGNRASFRKFERFLTRYVFVLLGIAFFIAAVVFLIIQAGQGNSFTDAISSFFTSAGTAETSGGTVYTSYNRDVLPWFLPAFLLLALPFLLNKRYPAFARIAVFAGTLWAFAVHIKVLSYDAVITGNCYSTLWIAMAVTLVISILPFWHAYKMRPGSLIMLITALFDISVLLLIFNYGWQYYQIFLFLILFTGVVFLLYRKTGMLAPFYVQWTFSFLLISVFWFRRLVMRDSGDLVLPYIIISSLFYITFYLSWLLTDLSKRKVVFELTALSLMLVSTLFYWGSVLGVLQKYGYPDIQGPFTLVLALFGVTLYYFLPKLNSNFSRKLTVFLMLFLFSMIIPLVIHQNYVILFSSVFSVLLVFYSKSARNIPALIGSIVMLMILLLMFIFEWAFEYFPGLYEGSGPINRALFTGGFLSGIFTVLAIFFNFLVIKRLEITLPWEWFSRHRYRRILKILLIATLYLTGYWCWDLLFTLVFPIEEAQPVSWFSFTCLYMIILVRILARQRSSLLMPVLGVAVLTMLSYPLLVNQAIIEIRDKGLQTGGAYVSCFIVHYLLLIMILTLMAGFYYYFMRARKNKRIVIHACQVFITGLTLCLVFMEYDHLMVYSGYNGKDSISEIVSRNHLLPWSIILLIASLLLTIYSVIYKHRFIRQVSFLLFIAAIVKILSFDFAYLGDNYKIVVLLVLGVFLISFSFLYQRFKRMVKGGKV
jgi:hypothetical protein